MRLHTDFFEKLHEKFPTITEDAVIEGFYKFLKDITIESSIEYPSEIDISSVTGTPIKFTDAAGNVIGVIEPIMKENFNHGIQLRVDDQVLGLFISDEYIATAIAPTPVPIQQGGNPKSIVTLDSFKQLSIYTLEELGLSFTEDGFIEIDGGDDSLSSVGFVKQQLDELKQEIIGMMPTAEEITKLSALPRGSIVVWTFKDIPKGWVICDGTNDTPDMRDKFIVGASNNRGINVIGSHGVSLSGSGLSFYSVYYIMKIAGNFAELNEVIWDTQPTPRSINPVTSGGIYAYYENKLKAISDRIDGISDSLDSIPNYTDLQKSIEVIKARLDKQYSGYESLVYCKTKPSGVEPVTFTTTAGTEYPGYYLFDSLSGGTEIAPDTTKKYAVYRCIEPSECYLKYTPGSGAGGDFWTITYTLGKFEFVRWEN